MNECPCCASKLLRHVSHGKIYWFCPHCHEKMPDFSTIHVLNPTVPALAQASR